MIALSLGRCKPFFDGAVLGVPCVNRTGPGKLQIPATSAMPRKRRPAKCGPLLRARFGHSRLGETPQPTLAEPRTALVDTDGSFTPNAGGSRVPVPANRYRPFSVAKVHFVAPPFSPAYPRSTARGPTLMSAPIPITRSPTRFMSLLGMEGGPGAVLTSSTMTHIHSFRFPRGDYPKRATMALRRSFHSSPSRVMLSVHGHFPHSFGASRAKIRAAGPVSAVGTWDTVDRPASSVSLLYDRSAAPRFSAERRDDRARYA